MTGLPDHTFTAPDGRSFTLRFSIRAMGILQKHYKCKSLSEVGERLNDAADMGVDDMIAVFGAGLAANHRDMSPDDIEELADTLGPASMMAQIREAMAAASPAAKADGGEEADRP